ncbi:hypothetical protein G7046_g2071 [Stylonectria norvegica]|nr:hypothetical protein G7046_g2071 [Stylonectria norvegica]
MIRQIQKQTPGTAAAPLFLFHDASGTISNYRALGLLGRDVYAIADSRVEGDEGESLQEMSRRYYALIKSTIAEGNILVGGWSLGGMIALQVAWICSRDPKINVSGILMVDSPFPDYRHALPSPPESPTSEDGPNATQRKFERSMLQTVNMLHKWRVPVWRREPQPCTVMLCASDRVISDHPALSLVDQFRDSPTLGWNERADSLVVNETYSIKGHHFSIFEPRNVDSLTEKIATVVGAMELLAYDDDEDY